MRWILCAPRWRRPAMVHWDVSRFPRLQINETVVRATRLKFAERLRLAKRRQEAEIDLGPCEAASGLPSRWLARVASLGTLALCSTDVPGDCLPGACLALFFTLAPLRSRIAGVLEKFSSIAGRATPDTLAGVRRWLASIAEAVDCCGPDGLTASASCRIPRRMLPLSVLDAALAAVGCAATLVVVDECIMASAGRYSMHSIGSQEAGIARESNVILLYHMQTQHINFLHFVPTLLLLDTTSAVTSGCQTTLLGLLGETYAPFLCEPPHLDGHLRGLLAGGQPDSQPQLPSFCQSISGACNEDGEAEGYCEAVLAYQSVRICGQWVEGHPCGPITITPLEGGFAFQLDTLPPTAADYASNPSLIAEGYLWPTPSLANGGRRLLKLSATHDEDQQRSYFVDKDRSAPTNSVSDVCNPDVLWHIRLRCIDEEPVCVAERRCTGVRTHSGAIR